MLESVDSTIAGLRSVVGAHNDSDLATKLRLDKSTISGWRSRGRVPERFVQLLEPERVPEIDIWPELHDRGTALALARYVILRTEIVHSGDADKAIAAFLDVKPFWLVLNRAVLDLRSKVEALKIDLSAAAALLLQDDLRDPKATAARLTSHLTEDLDDNPWIKGWK